MWWIQGTRAVEPFFSNDLEGLIRVLGFLVSLAGLILVVVDRIASKRKAVEARLDILERDTFVMQNDIEGLRESFMQFGDKLTDFMNKLERKDEKVEMVMRKAGERLTRVEEGVSYIREHLKG